MLVLPQVAPSVEPASQSPEPRWVWSQTWSDVFLLHWPLQAHGVQCALPNGLTVETFAGQAWLSLVIFQLRLRPIWLPDIPFVSRFTEVNLRTYVRCGQRTGIYFLSIDAHNRLAVALARWLTPLPYRFAAMQFQPDAESFSFRRYGNSVAYELQLSAAGPRKTAPRGSCDEWLLERYMAFASRENLFFGEATHAPWRYQEAHAALQGTQECWWPGLPPGLPVRAHYANRVEALFSQFCRV